MAPLWQKRTLRWNPGAQSHQRIICSNTVETLGIFTNNPKKCLKIWLDTMPFDRQNLVIFSHLPHVIGCFFLYIVGVHHLLAVSLFRICLLKLALNSWNAQIPVGYQAKSSKSLIEKSNMIQDSRWKWSSSQSIIQSIWFTVENLPNPPRNN